MLVVGGLILVSQLWSGMTLNPLGVFFGLLTAAALAAYLILGEAGARRRDVMSLAFWGFAIATVTWSILAPWWNFPWNLLTTTTSLFDGAVTGIPVWYLVIVMIAGLVTLAAAAARLVLDGAPPLDPGTPSAPGLGGLGYGLVFFLLVFGGWTEAATITAEV